MVQACFENGACHAEHKPIRVDHCARRTDRERPPAQAGDAATATHQAFSWGRALLPRRRHGRGWLNSRLGECKDGPFYKTDFSIGHRGAALQFPEHTKESYEAAARQGAGIVECDVTFTRDGTLVCRHSDCDLHTTTNIVETPLNAECEVPWTGPHGPSEPGAEVLHLEYHAR